MADPLVTMSDAELVALASRVLTKITATPADYGLTAALVTALDASSASLVTESGIYNTMLSETKAQKLVRDVPREGTIGYLRDIRNITRATKIGDNLVAELGIPSTTSAAPSNATVPIATVDTSKRLQHKIDFRDAGSQEVSRKPRGTIGCEIWVKIGDTPPASYKECTFLGLDTLTPYTADYDAEDAEKTAYYMLRWALKDNTYTTWGDIVAATITK